MSNAALAGSSVMRSQPNPGWVRYYAKWVLTRVAFSREGVAWSTAISFCLACLPAVVGVYVTRHLEPQVHL